MLERPRFGVRRGPWLLPDAPELTPLQDVRGTLCGARRTVHADDRPRPVGQEPLASAASASSSWRRHAAAPRSSCSMLFADVRGSTRPRGEDGTRAPSRASWTASTTRPPSILVGHDGDRRQVRRRRGGRRSSSRPSPVQDACVDGRSRPAGELLRATGHGREGGPWTPDRGRASTRGSAYVGTVGDSRARRLHRARRQPSTSRPAWPRPQDPARSS